MTWFVQVFILVSRSPGNIWHRLYSTPRHIVSNPASNQTYHYLDGIRGYLFHPIA